MTAPVRRRCRQRGASLVVTLVMLVVVLLLGASAAQLALQDEKAARNERDRQVALQAAEAALMDAQRDIAGSPDAIRSRSAIFTAASDAGFPVDGGCTKAGLCRRAAAGSAPVWQSVDLRRDDANAVSVPYGQFTGQAFQTGAGSLPARPPRYIIELVRDTQGGQRADRRSYFYRITAIGFGARDVTQVVLQTFYRKEAG